MSCAAPHYTGNADTLWRAVSDYWTRNDSSPDATLGDDFGRSVTKATLDLRLSKAL